jgi:O-antigen ligase
MTRPALALRPVEVMPYWLWPWCLFLFLMPFEMLIAGLNLSLPVNALGVASAMLLAMAAPRGPGGQGLLGRYLAVTLLMLALSLSYFNSIDPAASRNALIPVGIIWVIYLVSTSRALTSSQIEHGLRAWLRGGAACALLTVICTMQGNTAVDGRGSIVLGSVVVDPNFLTSALLLPAAVGVYFLRQPKMRLEAIAILGLIGWATVLAQSRGGIVAIIIMGLAMLAWERRWKAIAVLVISLGIAFATLGPMLGRFNAGEDTTGNGRTEVWQIALAAGVQHGMTGLGLGTFHHVSGSASGFYWSLAPHNTYLQAFAETGSLGLLALLLALGVHLRSPQRSPMAGAIFAAMIGLAVAAVFLHFLTFKILWGGWILATQAAQAREPSPQASHRFGRLRAYAH